MIVVVRFDSPFDGSDHVGRSSLQVVRLTNRGHEVDEERDQRLAAELAGCVVHRECVVIIVKP